MGEDELICAHIAPRSYLYDDIFLSRDASISSREIYKHLVFALKLVELGYNNSSDIYVWHISFFIEPISNG